jgi:hypothetical protein
MRERLDHLQARAKEDVYGLPPQGVNEKDCFWCAQTDVAAPPRRPGWPIYDEATVDLMMTNVLQSREPGKKLTDGRYLLAARTAVFRNSWR